MGEMNTQPRGALLIGSVPLESSTAVFELAGKKLGAHLRRIPDGETAERQNWIGWQFDVLARTPQLEIVPQSKDQYSAIPRVRLREGASAEQVELPPLGYSDAAKAGYTEFARLQQAGVIPAGCRFQVSLPTPLAPVNVFIAAEDQAAIEPIYEHKLLDELTDITNSIPHHALAIQWDTAVEFALIEQVWPSHLHNVREEIIERLLRIGNQVPADVELGYHLCYGDSGHKHFKEPADASHLVDIANALADGLTRPLHWIHMPVPRNRTDEAYFAPLRNLRLRPETELYLGLVHYTDGVEGARKRIAAAQQAISNFGVATECGLGRRPAETIGPLLDIHASVTAPLR